MLLFGFVLFDEFGERPFGIQAASSDGYLLKRGRDSIVTFERHPDWRLSQDCIRTLGDRVAAMHEQAGQEAGPLILVDVAGDSWDERVDSLIRRHATMSSTAATVEDFVTRSLPPRTKPSAAPRERPIDLPDGRTYQSRSIFGVRDVEVLRTARNAHLAVSLSGPPGSGKSTAAMAAFGRDCEIVHCFEGMTREDLVGMLAPTPGAPGEYEFVDGPLIRAMERGIPAVIDDIGWMPPGVQALLLPITDDHRRIEVIDRSPNEMVTATTGFSVIITENPGVGWGVIEPLRDRIAIPVTVPARFEIAVDAGAPLGLVEVAKALERKKTGDSTQWVPSVRQLVSSGAAADIFGLDFAASALLSKCPADQHASVVDELARFVDVRDPLTSD